MLLLDLSLGLGSPPPMSLAALLHPWCPFLPGKEGKRDFLPSQGRSGSSWSGTPCSCSGSMSYDVCRSWAPVYHPVSPCVCPLGTSWARRPAPPGYSEPSFLIYHFACCDILPPLLLSDALEPGASPKECTSSATPLGVWGELSSPPLASFHLFPMVTQNLRPSDNQPSSLSFATGLLCKDNFLWLLGNYLSAPLSAGLFHRCEVHCAPFTQQ